MGGEELELLIAFLRQLGRDEGLDKAFTRYNINIILGPAESPITVLAAAAGKFFSFKCIFSFFSLQIRVIFDEPDPRIFE